MEDKVLKVFTAFSGYDSQCMALDRLSQTHGLKYDLVGWSEIDSYAIEAHNAVYPQWADRNFGDISLIDWEAVPDFDMFTYSFPCQDISVAGDQDGLHKDSGTRSSLLWECEKAVSIKKPRYLIMENVKALASDKFIPLLHTWLRLLESYGYVNHAQIMDASDYGCPQHRERLFVVSILGDGRFTFPNTKPLSKSLKDILEDEVDGKYYISQELKDKYLNKLSI